MSDEYASEDGARRACPDGALVARLEDGIITEVIIETACQDVQEGRRCSKTVEAACLSGERSVTLACAGHLPNKDVRAFMSLGTLMHQVNGKLQRAARRPGLTHLQARLGQDRVDTVASEVENQLGSPAWRRSITEKVVRGDAAARAGLLKGVRALEPLEVLEHFDELVEIGQKLPKTVKQELRWWARRGGDNGAARLGLI